MAYLLYVWGEACGLVSTSCGCGCGCPVSWCRPLIVLWHCCCCIAPRRCGIVRDGRSDSLS
ncbi:hypothetical protein BD779DRAFT_1560961, partial [Infundibulicybe gibba]